MAVAGGNAFVLGLGLLSGVIAARALGAHGRGQYFATYTMASTFSVVLSLGVVQTLVTYKGRDRELGRPLVVQAGIATGAACALLAGLAWHTHPWLDFVGIAGGTAVTLGSLLSSFSAALAQRRGDMARGFQSVRLIPQGALVLGMIGLWASDDQDPNRWLLATGLALLLPAGIQFVNAVRRHWHRQGSWKPESALLRQTLVTLPVMLGTLMIYRLDAIVVSLAFPPQKVGLYAVALAALTACSAIGNAVGMVTFSQLPHITGHSERKHLIYRSLGRTLAITSVVALPAIVFAPYLVEALYGSEFAQAANVVRVLAVTSVACGANFLMLHVLLVIEGHRRQLRILAVVTVVMAVALISVAPTHQLMLVAAVALMSHMLVAVLLIDAVRRELRVSGSVRTE